MTQENYLYNPEYEIIREGKVSRTIAIGDEILIDVDKDGRILGVESIYPPITVNSLLRVLYEVRLVNEVL